MFGAESTLTPQLPGVNTPAPMPGMNQHPNPFQGIRRAGQAKRAQNFAKFQQNQGPHASNPKQLMGILVDRIESVPLVVLERYHLNPCGENLNQKGELDAGSLPGKPVNAFDQQNGARFDFSVLNLLQQLTQLPRI